MQWTRRKRPILRRLTSFRWSSMYRMLCSVACDDFVDSRVTSEREVNFYDVVTRLHKSEDSLYFVTLVFERCSLLHVFHQWILNDLAAAMEKILYLFGNWKIDNFDLGWQCNRCTNHVKELRILGSRDVLKALGNLMVRVAARLEGHSAGSRQFLTHKWACFDDFR